MEKDKKAFSTKISISRLINKEIVLEENKNN